MRSIEEVNSQDFANLKLAIYSGNLKRGAQIRELRTSRQVTQNEMSDALWERFGDDERVPCSNFAVSMAERGITAMSDRVFFAFKSAITFAASQEGAKDRRKLYRRRERARRAA